MDFPECNSRVQDAHETYREASLYMHCLRTATAISRKHLRISFGILHHAQAQRDQVTHPWLPKKHWLASDIPYAKVPFQPLIHLSFAKTQTRFPHASNYLTSTPPVHSRSLFLLRSPRYPGWTFHTESHALTVKAFPTSLPHKGRICYLYSEESCRAHASASTSR